MISKLRRSRIVAPPLPDGLWARVQELEWAFGSSSRPRARPGGRPRGSPPRAPAGGRGPLRPRGPALTLRPRPAAAAASPPDLLAHSPPGRQATEATPPGQCARTPGRWQGLPQQRICEETLAIAQAHADDLSRHEGMQVPVNEWDKCEGAVGAAGCLEHHPVHRRKRGGLQEWTRNVSVKLGARLVPREHSEACIASDSVGTLVGIIGPGPLERRRRVTKGVEAQLCRL